MFDIIYSVRDMRYKYGLRFVSVVCDSLENAEKVIKNTKKASKYYSYRPHESYYDDERVREMGLYNMCGYSQRVIDGM